ncbi:MULTISPECIES: DUF1150 family protein [Paracoccus]|jgi:hypothetical protein|uniref:DUF1150 family protein n=1 Tax=Paracoccus TaxID=265 RepID=UPI0005DF025A|nr:MULTISPECIES: DUF1150 family protein [Paracoccus]TYP60477.1 hypothetical protein A9A71_12181 [Stutzerimonas stutzeri]AZY94076.1 DUF1150 family protein [Paracoccus sp. Arc7-R13]KIX19061.1 hypothetical protein SY26_02780 [Paracoccus sp. 228]MBF5079954.1 DUF1150 family protein [Paracoccus sp. NBH48]MCO6362844.1 DUF1150 family protein [Paracoccus sp. 08]|tara:strand:- start:1152 stop:1379 length:228 start_codon:yes stop_codon:yes gene_type:complete
MDSKFDFGGGTSAQTVYIRQVAAATLPRDVQDQLPGVQTLYAVHDTDGERLALVQDRALAFTLARENELRPVSVH